jgi:hypothetical protein
VPGFVFLAIASALAVIIAMLPRTGNQVPPPTVAEFAPEAASQIRKAIAEQSSQHGSGEGACETGQSCVGSTPTPVPRPTIHPPSTKVVCVLDPIFHTEPRQIDDPQSPPCNPFWSGENGGATSKGVTKDEIIVALPRVAYENPEEVKLLAKFFNDRFQLYGRKITLKEFTARGGLNQRPVPEEELDDAKDVDEKFHAFASLTTGGRYGAEQIYYDALARRGIISVAHRAGSKTDEAYLRKFKPYRWSVLPGIDTMQRHIAEMVCKVLAGKAPEYAGPGSIAANRVFGLIYGRATDGTKPDVGLLRHALTACGVQLAADVEHEQKGDAAGATNTMLKMVQAGVTSVICICDYAEVSGVLMQAASGQQYRPEWILSTYIDNDVDNSFAQAPPDQATHVIGATFRNKWLPRENMPWYWALKDEDPSGDNPPAQNGYALAARYSSLLLLASGIQLAGPNLTPATFERGLLQAVGQKAFPNPGAGRAPYYQARVGFDGLRHTMIGDAAMYWYSRSDRGTVDPAALGAVCYVHQGTRYALGAWPRENPAFYGDCRSG